MIRAVRLRLGLLFFGVAPRVTFKLAVETHTDELGGTHPPGPHVRSERVDRGGWVHVYAYMYVYIYTYIYIYKYIYIYIYIL